MSVLFPAPDGPIMAVNSPDLNFPFTHFRMVLYPAVSAQRRQSKLESLSLAAIVARRGFIRGSPSQKFGDTVSDNRARYEEALNALLSDHEINIVYTDV